MSTPSPYFQPLMNITYSDFIKLIDVGETLNVEVGKEEAIFQELYTSEEFEGDILRTRMLFKKNPSQFVNVSQELRKKHQK